MTILANTGVPMLMVQLPLMVMTLPVVIFIEAALCKRWFRLTWVQSLKATSIANLVSTFFGFPILWIILVAFQMSIGGGGFPDLQQPWYSIYSVTAQAPWLLPIENELYWMIPTASLVLLFPSFFATILIEWVLYRRIFKGHETTTSISSAVWKMHLASYAFLFIAGFGLLSQAVNNHKIRSEQAAPSNP